MKTLPDVICPHCQGILTVEFVKRCWAQYTNGLRRTFGGGRPIGWRKEPDPRGIVGLHRGDERES